MVHWHGGGQLPLLGQAKADVEMVDQGVGAHGISKFYLVLCELHGGQS